MSARGQQENKQVHTRPGDISETETTSQKTSHGNTRTKYRRQLKALNKYKPGDKPLLLNHFILKCTLLIQQFAEMLMPPLQHFCRSLGQLSILLPHCTWPGWLAPGIHTYIHKLYTLRVKLIFCCILKVATN